MAYAKNIENQGNSSGKKIKNNSFRLGAE